MSSERLSPLLGLLLSACVTDKLGAGALPPYEGDDAGECSDGLDNDGNGLVDCDDAGCRGSPLCKGGGETGGVASTDTDSGDEEGGHGPHVHPDTDTAPPDTDGPALTLIADEDPSTTSGHSFAKSISGEGQILDDGARFEGTVDYVYQIDDERWCDAEIALSGEADETTCEGCDYVFGIDAEVTRDDGLPWCDLVNAWTMVSDGFYVNQHLGFASSYEAYGSHGWATYTDVLLAGVGYDFDYIGGEGYFPGPYFLKFIFDGPYQDQGWLTLDDETVAWGFETSGEDVTLLNHYQYCHSWYSQATRGWLRGTKVSGSVDCNATVMDGWSFEASAGDTLTVTVDAPDKDANFVPMIFVNGPDGCAVTRAMENYVCSDVERLGYTYTGCAAAEFSVDQSGAYDIWILSAGTNCLIGTRVSYDLYVNLFDSME